MSTEDLSALDRNTLRLWRTSNLVAWGLAGAAAGIVTFVISIRALAGFIEQVTRGSSKFTYLTIALTVALGGVVAGSVIGGHVYRAPGIVAAASIMTPALLITFGLAVTNAAEGAFALITPVIGATVAAAVARVAFRRRPRSLRAPR